MITIQGMKKEPAHWPGSLRSYGLNPFDEPLYRVVWSDSRLHLVGGKWPNGECEYRWIPLYPVSCWVMEKWLSAEAYAGSPAKYEASMKDLESGLLACGPYPERGEYETSFLFEGEPSSSLIATLIGMIERGRDYSQRDNRNALLDAENKSRKAALDRCGDIWTDSQGAFGNRMTNLNPAKLTAEKMRLDISAEQIKSMPKGDSKFFSR
jgi:hypothetical protein